MSTEAERKALGEFLRGTREACGKTREDVQTMTDGTVAADYLARLELAQVELPAPHILYALAGCYVISYEKLIELAGHVRRRAYEPKGADLHVRMALSCLEELEPEAMARKRRMVRNFNEHNERESQLSAARVSLDRALDLLTPKT